ncbi:hypothetical protein HDU76_009966, partial [Blyttiomyces sp. JEL0837]
MVKLRCFALEPAFGTVRLVPAGLAIQFELHIVLESSSDGSKPCKPLSPIAELWTNSPNGNLKSTDGWHAITMKPVDGTDLSSPSTFSFCYVMDALTAGTQFEFTARVRLNEEMCWLGDDGGPKNGFVSVVGYKNGQKLSVADFITIPGDKAQTFLGSDAGFIERSHKQEDHTMITLGHTFTNTVLYRKSNSWLEPARGTSAWPIQSLDKESIMIILEGFCHFCALIVLPSFRMRLRGSNCIYFEKSNSFSFGQPNDNA